MAKFNDRIHHMKDLVRLLDAILNATGMCFAWCLLWATKWVLHRNAPDLSHLNEDILSHDILGRVSLAFVLTTFACVSVFVVDRIADSMRTTYENQKDTLEFVEELIRVIINSLGILVGFSWEHSFDGSVEDIADNAPLSGAAAIVNTELILGVAVCALILPAWREYILHKVMLMEDMLKKKRGLTGDEEREEEYVN